MQTLDLSRKDKIFYIWIVFLIFFLWVIDWILLVQVAFRLNESLKQNGLGPCGLTKFICELGKYSHSTFGSIIFLAVTLLIWPLTRPVVMKKVKKKYLLGILLVMLGLTILVYLGIYRPSGHLCYYEAVRQAP